MTCFWDAILQRLTQEDFNNLQQIRMIIKESGSIGTFKLGNLEIIIHKMEELQTNLIFNDIEENKHV